MRTLKRNGRTRRKALFGSDGAMMAAATLTAAGMNVAAQTAAAIMGANATEKAAKASAEATKHSADINSQALKQQSENDKNLQEKNIETAKELNADNRDLQRDTQLTLQMLAGQENTNDRLEAMKQELKYGGRRKCNVGGNKSNTLFYGRGNTGFKVTDGGYLVPIQVDENGFGLYEAKGDNHEHYHKTKSGKYKSGVGIKFANGSEIELEGDQNTGNGELFLHTPTDDYAISKHTVGLGYNPKRDIVENGENPMNAFMKQEYAKIATGKNDDGSSKAKCGRRLRHCGRLGAKLDPSLSSTILYNSPFNDTVNTGSGVAYIVNGSNTSPVEENTSDSYTPIRQLKRNGGRRKCGYGGVSWWDTGVNASMAGNLGGAALGTIGNLIGAGITSGANRRTARYMTEANNYARDVLVDAYNQMSGIDMNAIDKNDFSAAHAMAAVRSASTNVNPQLERLRRNADWERRQILRRSGSGAAKQQAFAGINDRMYQRMSEVYASKYNQDEAIRQKNNEMINATAQLNAKLDAETNGKYTAAKLDLLKYNNNINNAKIAGIANAQANAATTNAAISGQAAINNASTWGNAITNITNSWTNAGTSIIGDYTQRREAERKEAADFFSNNNDIDHNDLVNKAIMTNNLQIKAEVAKTLTGYNEFIKAKPHPTIKDYDDFLKSNMSKKQINY